jgi:hypothetical protein
MKALPRRPIWLSVEMELLAHRFDERAGDVAVVEIEDIDGEEHHHGEPQTLLLGFL